MSTSSPTQITVFLNQEGVFPIEPYITCEQPTEVIYSFLVSNPGGII